jgi:hypothetical protein
MRQVQGDSVCRVDVIELTDVGDKRATNVAK